MSKDDDDYKVGKGRPPKHTRFKKGQSGNPSGRKKLPDLTEVAALVLEETLPVTQDGVGKKMLGAEALYRKFFAKALTGDIRAAEFVIRPVVNANARRSEGGHDDAGPQDDADDDIIERYYERYARRLNAGGDRE